MENEITAPTEPYLKNTNEPCVICYPPDDLTTFFNESEGSRSFVVCPTHSDDEVRKRLQELKDSASQTLGYPVMGKLIRGMLSVHDRNIQKH